MSIRERLARRCGQNCSLRITEISEREEKAFGEIAWVEEMTVDEFFSVWTEFTTS